MTNTKRLSSMLEKRGIEYDDESYLGSVFWGNASYEQFGDGHTRLIVENATPEQAIAATVGTAMTLDEAIEYAERFMGDYAKVLLEESTLYVERDEPTDQHAFNMAERKEGQMARDLAEALATVGSGTDLSKRLREVHGLHAFAELFGFDWHDESDWDWHDVACAMADAIDATAGTDYAITFAPTLDRPPETMVGETVFDSEGNAIGWIVNATAEPDEATMLKLHDRMNAALLHYERAMGIEGGNGANTVPFVIEMHQIIEDAATIGVGTCRAIDTGYATAKCSECDTEFMGSIMTNEPPDYVKPLERCPRCGRRIIEEATE